VNKIKHKLKRGLSFKVNNGERVLFWEDVWLGRTPLKLTFSKLYEYCRNKDCLISECYKDGEWVIDFKRPLLQAEVVCWEALLDQLKAVRLNDRQDKAVWKLEKTGNYSTKSMYRCLSHRGIVNQRIRRVWKSKLPMKLKVFMWLACQNRIQSGEALKKMNWKGDPSCAVCGRLESADHILFECLLPKFVWTCLKQAMGWERVPLNFQDFFDWLPLQDKHYKLKLFGLANVVWVLWNVRNKMSIEGVFPNDPANTL
jgi:hypothetical protein